MLTLLSYPRCSIYRVYTLQASSHLVSPFFWTCHLTNNPSAVIAANGALRYTFGAIFPLFTVQMYERLGTAWASGAFALLSLLFVPIPIVLCKYGERLRRSQAATQSPKAIEGSEAPI